MNTTKPHSTEEVERDEKWSDELQHAYDSILFNHNPIEVDRPFASMLEKVLIKLLHHQLQKARDDAWQEAVDLADKIELQEPDGGTKQWMAFKAFRNTLRDKIKDHSELDQDNK